MDSKTFSQKIAERTKHLEAAFKESEHPRADDGKFGEGGGGSSSSGDSSGGEGHSEKGAHQKDIDASVNVVAGAIDDDHFGDFEEHFTEALKNAPVEKLSPDDAKKVFTAHKYTFETDPDNDDMHKRGKENRGKEVTDPSVLVRFGDKVYALDGQHRLNRAITEGRDARAVIIDGSQFEKYGLKEKFFEGRTQRLAKAKKMNIGKLVREKMKLSKVDASGEYVDSVGKHFTMKLSEGGGYTVSYGGDKKREIEINDDQAKKLAASCRKLELADKK